MIRSLAIATILALWCTASVIAQSTKPVKYNLDGQPPYLVAHYMMWYTAPWSAGNDSPVDRTVAKWSHWGWEGKGATHDPNRMLADGKRDIASVVYPLIGAYDSGSKAVIDYHLACMKAAGVSAVSDLWYGASSNTGQRMPLLLDEAEKMHMKVFICYEEKINFADYRHPKTRDDVVKSATEDLTYILDNYASHPAYLRRNGIPVVQQFNGYGKDPAVGSRQFTPEEWKTIFSKLPGNVEYIRQNLEENYYPPIQAAYVWWDQGKWPRQFADRAAILRDQGKVDFFMSMVCPGFNDTGVWGWGDGPRLSKGYGLDVLASTMKQALVHDPELVQMVTWNDFNESTCFEPTTQNGTKFLESLASWWHQSAGKEVHPEQLKDAFEQYKKNCSDTERAEIPQ